MCLHLEVLFESCLFHEVLHNFLLLDLVSSSLEFPLHLTWGCPLLKWFSFFTFPDICSGNRGPGFAHLLCLVLFCYNIRLIHNSYLVNIY